MPIGSYVDPNTSSYYKNGTYYNNGSPSSTPPLTPAKQNVNDYGSIMSGYSALASQPRATAPVTSAPVNYQPVNPAITSYTESPDTTAALGDLKNLASTGGYTPEGIADIRARGIAPIRSIYSNAQQALSRSKALQGGYSPGYTAALASMARDESGQIAGATTNVNAGLAQDIASNELQAAPAYAGAASSEAGRATSVAQGNTAAVNNANQFNASNVLDTNKYNTTTAINNQNTNNTNAQAEQERQQQILQGKTSLYGTTPAMASTFGNQTLNAAQLQHQQLLDAAKLRQSQAAPLYGGA